MILNAFNLEGKVAIVTGCDTGLGQGMALGLAQAGADVVGVGYVAADETKEQIEALGRKFHYITANLIENCDPKSMDAIVEEAVNVFGRIDILVNNAGIIRRCDAIEFSESDWDDVMNINSKTVFFLSQAASKQFIAQEQGGKIVNIASMLSFQGGIRVPSYTASKSAVQGVTRAMANEWAQHGITVNAIAPGYFATNNTAQLRADADRNAEILERIPAQRWGNPEDLQGAVVFLCSKASDYVNGYTLAVDGGWLSR